MWLTYQPEGSDEPHRWWYDWRKMSSTEAIIVEKITGKTFTEINNSAIYGSDESRKALVYLLLKRQHPTLKYADLSYDLGAVTLEPTKDEVALLVDRLRNQDAAESVISAVERQMEEAPDHPEDVGKANLPIRS